MAFGRKFIPWGRDKDPLAQGEWEPLDVLRTRVRTLRTRVNDIFDDFYHGIEMEPSRLSLAPWRRGVPRMDIAEMPDEIRVELELPGVDEEDVNVMLTENKLVIEGEKHSHREEHKEEYRHVERAMGSFRREVDIDCEIEADEVQAVFRNGVLFIRLPKVAVPEEQIRKIPVGA